MENLNEIFEKLFNGIINLSADQIALISIMVSFILYMLSKHSELKFKKYEAKKENYSKLINAISEIFQNVNKRNFLKKIRKNF